MIGPIEPRPSRCGGLIASTAEPKPSSVVPYLMQYSLRTLLILMAVGPPILAGIFAGSPLVAMLIILGLLEIGLLSWVYGTKQIADRPRTSSMLAAMRWIAPGFRFTIRDWLAIAGIATASCLVGLSFWGTDTPEEFGPVAALFVFGATCYGLGAFINHPRRTLPARGRSGETD
jgi:hypothetical protein